MTTSLTKIDTTYLNSWEEFEKRINEDNENFESVKNELRKNKQHGSISKLLFRGHSDACWTLERFCKIKLKKVWSIKDYHALLERILPIVKSETIRNFDLPIFNYSPFPNTPIAPPGIEFMAYLRHHGFPSPLLDWTQCFYTAAFFAFDRPKIGKWTAIYSFREICGNFKSPPYPNSFGPQILTVGPYITTDNRHFNQKSEYSYCRKNTNQNGEWCYCPHEDVGKISGQDNLKKYLLPTSERDTVIKILESENINEKELFGTKEDYMDASLMKKLDKELDQFLKEQ